MTETTSGVDPRPGRRLRARRGERGWSLSRLERETHYSRGYLSRVENGMQRMTEDLAQACDRALGADGELLAAVRSGLGQECPYPGMTSYSEHTARWFFGRDEAVGKLLAEVRRQLLSGRGLYAVVAPSGAGPARKDVVCAAAHRRARWCAGYRAYQRNILSFAPIGRLGAVFSLRTARPIPLVIVIADHTQGRSSQ
ncbi:helix-turn-helix domain-containing protein [Catenulispora sp. GP43]|uniref:helix-turn-helix domain-containing protein n=1 Tax=Catenulispora sp. GP43 TaxID=3156263 RepID=UPI00351157CA